MLVPLGSLDPSLFLRDFRDAHKKAPFALARRRGDPLLNLLFHPMLKALQAVCFFLVSCFNGVR